MIPIKENAEDGGMIAFKVVVVNGFDSDYAAYYGPTEWSDEEIAAGGYKLPRNLSELLALEIPFLQHQRFSRTYRR